MYLYDLNKSLRFNSKEIFYSKYRNMIIRICSFLYKLWGWKITGHYPKEVKKKMLVVVPHTSIMDFFVGILAKVMLDDDIKFVGKSTLFKGPLGWFLKHCGFVPVDRTQNTNFVQAVAEEFHKREKFTMGLAPEGTRKRVEKLKTGFYYMAKAANAPVFPVTFDYKNKEIHFGPKFEFTDNVEEDLSLVYEYFRGVQGYKPEYSI